MSYKCSDKDTHTQNIHNSSTRSHPSEAERLEITAKIAILKKSGFYTKLTDCDTVLSSSFLENSFRCIPAISKDEHQK
jgi:hypothetical protein